MTYFKLQANFVRVGIIDINSFGNCDYSDYKMIV